MHRKIASLLILGITGNANAKLGGDQYVPVPEDLQIKIKTTVERISSTGGHYILVKTVFGSGTELHEYLSIDGMVFAEAWRGPVVPDFPELLGSYMGQYVDAINAPRPGGGRTRGAGVSVVANNVVIEVGGHMGAFTGRAWLPPALPAGITTDNIE